MTSQAFREIMTAEWPGLSIETKEKVVRFRELVLAENEVQNLTRLTSPRDFFSGHVIDVRELLKMAGIGCPAMDLGSGAGVPGLLAALIDENENPEYRWILAESEVQKAKFLERTVDVLGLSEKVRVFPGRGEAFLLKDRVQTIVCRAVGSTERIMGWIGKCSTWNSLVLFKGPRWEEEWSLLQKTKWGDSLEIQKKHEYSLPDTGAKRVIIQLRRVPRGTKSNKNK